MSDNTAGISPTGRVTGGTEKALAATVLAPDFRLSVDSAGLLGVVRLARMQNENHTTAEEPEVRLAKLRRAKACIVYHENLPDPEYPTVRCSIYGVPKTNELYVELTNGRVSFVASAPSPVAFPPMADRIFGLAGC